MQKRLNLFPQPGIGAAGLLKKCGAVLRLKIERSMEQLFDPAPTIGRVHAAVSPYDWLCASSRCSQALANFNSR